MIGATMIGDAITGDAVAEAAANLIGTKYRLHGRDPRFGLDCVGLVACALTDAGKPVVGPTHYALRNNQVSDSLIFAKRSGLTECSGPILTGDIVLTKPGPAQFHLAIKEAGGGFIHAHAGLRKVALLPAPLPWPVLRHWRV